MPDTADTELQAWQVSHVRVTAFPEPSVKYGIRDTWQQLTGEIPESRIERPVVGVSQERGPYKHGVLVLHGEPDKLELRFAGAPERMDEESLRPFDTLGGYPDIRDTFRGLALKWIRLSDFPPVTRFAYGLSVIHPVADFSAGSALLSRMLPWMKLDTTAVGDFLFQRNRPTRSRLITDRGVNRVAKWSFVTVQKIVIPLGADPRPRMREGLSSELGCRVDVDINTDTSSVVPIPENAIPELFAEFVAHAERILLTRDDMPE